MEKLSNGRHDAICPIEYNERARAPDYQMAQLQTNNNMNNNGWMQNYSMNMPNQEVLTPENIEKLYMKQISGEMDIQNFNTKEKIKYSYKIAFDKERERLREERLNAKIVVYEEPDGQLMVSIYKGDKQANLYKVGFVKNLRMHCLFCTFPINISILVLTWDNGCKNKFFIKNDNNKVVDQLIKQMKKRDLLPRLNREMTGAAVSAMLVFLQSNCNKVEIPYNYGWSKRANGNYHFVLNNEEVMLDYLEGRR